jgi:cytochrome P450
VKDDILPLSTPITLADGTETQQVFVAKYTRLIVPIIALNRSPSLWGDDAWCFRPERWLDGTPSSLVQDIPGYRNLLTFLDGPKSSVTYFKTTYAFSLSISHRCLGRGFAVTNFKTALAVLIRKYQFELPNGPETTISTIATVVARPRVDGESGCTVPVRVSKVVK